MKRLLTGVLLLAMLASLIVACAPEEEEPAPPEEAEVIELKWATYEAEAHWRTPVMHWFADELEERTDGRIKTTIYTGGTLGGPAELLDNLLKGVCDQAVFVASTYPGAVWAQPLFMQPGIAIDPAAGAWVMMDLINEGYYELEGAKILCAHRSEIGGLILANKKVTKLADLKGLVSGGTPASAPWVEALGMSFAAAPPPEIYGMLERGVIDANLLGSGLAKAQKLGEITKYFLVGLSSGDVHLVAMNIDTFNSIPAKDQVILLELSMEANVKLTREVYDQGDISLDYLRGEGVEVYWPSPEFDAEIRALAETFVVEVVEELDAEGFPAKEAWEIIIKDCKALGLIRE